MEALSVLRHLPFIAVVASAGLGFGLSAAAREVDTGILTEGAVMTYTVYLSAGSPVSYAVCGDSDTRDIDLDVLDPYRDIIAADYDSDAVPDVTFLVRRSGKYKVRVHMEDTFRGVASCFTLHRL